MRQPKRSVFLLLLGSLLGGLLASTAEAQIQPPRPEGVGVGVSLDVEEVLGRQMLRFGRVYSVKFLCGTILHGPLTPQAPPVGSPLVPGTYLTAVNIHNFNPVPVKFRKKAVIANPQGQPRGRVGQFVAESLGPNEALEVDCQNVKELLVGGATTFDPLEPFLKGFVEVVLPPQLELEVVGVYTLKNVVPGPERQH